MATTFADVGAPGSQSWLRLARLAKLLASLTLLWLGVEGAVGVVAGILAGSIALVPSGWTAPSRASRASLSFGGFREQELSRLSPSGAPSDG
jgi:hypothetical protein